MKLWRSLIVHLGLFLPPRSLHFIAIFTDQIAELIYSLSSFAADNSLKKKKNRTSQSHVGIAKQCCVMGETWKLRWLLLSNQGPHSSTSDRSTAGRSCRCWHVPALNFWVKGIGRKSLWDCPRAALSWEPNEGSGEESRNPLQRVVLGVNWNASTDPPRKHKPNHWGDLITPSLESQSMRFSTVWAVSDVGCKKA